MLYNAVITITQFVGDQNNKTKTSTTNGVRALITPADNTFNALYELPVGQGFQFNLYSDSLTSILPESTLSVTDGLGQELTNSDVFVVKGLVKKQKIFGQYLFSGVCIKK